ncbi:MAG: 1-deoxy-D-xylulose-5-phosphate reductoisomerase [Moraxellaceae bacterium]|nr:1-deoxy-D-xylulose-5-phosphate reductoisomerase [Moraxellaceae bacterium]
MSTLSNVTVLGATGSIGLSTLDVLARHPDRYQVHALSAHSRIDELAHLCLRHQPRYAVVPNDESASYLTQILQAKGCQTEVLAGAEALAQVASDAAVDTVMAAIVGAAGLLPTLAAVNAGKRVLLANKEALVMSGALFMQAVRNSGSVLLPIDSEHNAIFQCLPHDAASRDLTANGVEKIVLTASGGPFRTWTLEQLASVTPAQAVAHPNWSMGRKISVDSATLMNKGLEFIEACWLFDAKPSDIEVLVHPQSVIHSMVRYHDGSVIAQMGNPDMRTPIAHALAWPHRITAGVSPLDLTHIAQLNFEAPDTIKFPCLVLAQSAIAQGGTMPTTLNAANEVAVDAFLRGKLAFTAIAQVIEQVMNQSECSAANDLTAILAADAEARVRASHLVKAC